MRSVQSGQSQAEVTLSLPKFLVVGSDFERNPLDGIEIGLASVETSAETTRRRVASSIQRKGSIFATISGDSKNDMASNKGTQEER